MEIEILQERCKGCDLCLRLCSKGVFQENEVMGANGFKLRIAAYPENCVSCGFCELFCPEGAVILDKKSLLDEFWEKIRKAKERAVKGNRPRGGWRRIKTRYPGIHNVNGNTAWVWGAIDADCKAIVSYPITPATPQAYEAVKHQDIIFYQAEKEDVCMIALCAASFVGLKAMSSTSGPGFSRMLENTSFAFTNELPLVIVDVQRTGPSTGRPTRTGAGEVREVRWASHGGTEHIVLYPSSVQECYDLAVETFNLAEQFRVPVIVLMEASIANLEERIEIPEEINVFDRIYIPGAPFFGPIEDSSSLSMPRYGEGEFLKVTGLTHNRWGIPCSNDPEIHEEMVKHQRAKVISKIDELTRVEEYFLEDAEIMMVAYGHTARAVKWAIDKAREKEIPVGLLRPIILYPFPEKKIEEWSKKVLRVDVPEMNQGQLFYVIRENCTTPVISLPQSDGENIDPRRILRHLEESRGRFYREGSPVTYPTIYNPSSWQREKKEIPERTFSFRTPFCRGCGLGTLRNCLLQVIKELKWDPQKIVVVSGIGCTARLPNHLPFESANTTHGYGIPFATWIKWLSPDLHVIVISGDGDEFNIGLGETLFGAKRNVPITVICFNNFIFGMTGGQVAGTTPLGAKTSTTPSGNPEKPLDLVKMMLASGAKFTARCPISKPFVLVKMLREALAWNDEQRGLSFLEVIFPCLDQYVRRNIPVSSAELMKKLNQIYISRTQKFSRSELKRRFKTSFPFRKSFEPEIEDEELLQLVYGKFADLREYVTLLPARRKK